MEGQNGTKAPRKMLVIVDFDNLRNGHELYDSDRLPRWLMDRLQAYGEIGLAYVFVDRLTMPDDMARALSIGGFTVVDCPKLPIQPTGGHKDTVDQLAIEHIHRVLTLARDLDTIVLVSGDRDYVPCLSTWAGRGKEIYVLAGTGMSAELGRVAHKVLRFSDHSPPAQIQPFVLTFARLLEKGGLSDYRKIYDKPMVSMRDKLVSFMRDVVMPMVADGCASELTAPFIQKGLGGQPGLPGLNRVDLEHLVRVLSKTVFDAVPEDQDRWSLYPNQDHPFMRYMATLPVAETVEVA